MNETRKLAAILVSDVVGYSRLAGRDEELTLARLRALRSDLIDPIIAVHHGRIVKGTGDGAIVEFRSVVDAVRCAIEVQNGIIERNIGVPPVRRIEFRIGVHLGDVMEESDGDLMGDGVNIAARLQSICEPNGICLSEDAYRQVKSRLDLSVTDLGDKELKNIVEPIRVYSLTVGVPAHAKPVTPATAPKRTRDKLLIPVISGLAALLVIAAVAVWYFLLRPSANLAANLPAHLSIVVLPFANLSNDPKQDYFADGITDNLTTDLSRIRNSFVIARNTAFTYQGKNVDAKEIGKELGVRYVLEGSVQRDGNRVSVDAQLIDAESGVRLWADRFEEDLADLFKLQDDMVTRLANALGYERISAETQKAAHSANPDAIDLTMQGWALLAGIARDRARYRYEQAHDWFERALKIDPNNADALAGDARVYEREFSNGMGSASTDYETKITSLSDRAIALNPGVIWAYSVKSTYLYLSRRSKESLEVANAGIAINPNFAPLYMARRGAEISLGRFKEAAADVQHAMRLSPRDPEIALWHMQLGTVQFRLKNFHSVIEEENQAIDGGYRGFLPYTYLAAVFALTGRQENAKAALEQAQRLNPRLTSMNWLLSHSPNLPRYFEGMRKAGLPEDEPPPPAHLSVVVLPFTNLSGDPKQDYFADGVTDNLTTDLSRIRNSFVIARNTAFTYKGKAVDAKEIGKDLGVRYVLEGSVQRDGNRVRVNAQLNDAESGAHLWADRFEEDVADLFKLQDDVVARLANTLGYELVKTEAEKSAHSTNLDAIDLTMQGWSILNGPPSKDGDATARDRFQRALALDASNVDAVDGLALADLRDSVYGSPGAQSEAYDRAKAEIDRAIDLDPNNALAYEIKGSVIFYKMRDAQSAHEAMAAAETALSLEPMLAGAYFLLAPSEEMLGKCAEAKSHLEQAIKISPRDPDVGRWHAAKSRELFCLKQYDAAIGDANIALDSGYRTFNGYIVLAANYEAMGYHDDAQQAVASARRLNPQLSIKWYQKHLPSFVDNPPDFIDAVRKAGLPEDSPALTPKHVSIVVLPFDNLSGDPKQDYFADGVTDNLTTDLSRIRNSFVIARNTAFTYKGKSVDAKEIGKELGVRYVLEGSVARDGNRVRVNAQLIDAESGSHLWADRFEEEMADLFKLQDEIVGRLANVLNIELVNAESEHGGTSPRQSGPTRK